MLIVLTLEGVAIESGIQGHFHVHNEFEVSLEYMRPVSKNKITTTPIHMYMGMNVIVFEY